VSGKYKVYKVYKVVKLKDKRHPELDSGSVDLEKNFLAPKGNF